ncbi:hypothetical protein BRD00_03795 [Halobacteriales archaeon QS_8_69_26]|nr:MAG: hypothetical protein BRD00_03795 [Halobacteriales archaeon QS_8_69_26]
MRQWFWTEPCSSGPVSSGSRGIPTTTTSSRWPDRRTGRTVPTGPGAHRRGRPTVRTDAGDPRGPSRQRNRAWPLPTPWTGRRTYEPAGPVRPRPIVKACQHSFAGGPQ